MKPLPNSATTTELLRWLASRDPVTVDAYYETPRGLRYSHSLYLEDWQIHDEGPGGETVWIIAEFAERYASVRWYIEQIDGEPVPAISEPMATAIQPGESVSIYTLQLALSGDTRDRLVHAAHCNEISETLREWQYAADVTLCDWRHLKPPVVVPADSTPPIVEGDIFPDADVTFRPDASAFTAFDQAQSRAQRPAVAAPASDYVVVFLDSGVVADWQYLDAAEAQTALADWAENAVILREGPWDDGRVYSAESEAVNGRDAWAFPLLDYAQIQPIPANFDVATVLAVRPDWDAATAARFLTEHARALAAGRDVALTEMLCNELALWERTQG